jgi:hypothetical protein
MDDLPAHGLQIYYITGARGCQLPFIAHFEESPDSRWQQFTSRAQQRILEYGENQTASVSCTPIFLDLSDTSPLEIIIPPFLWSMRSYNVPTPQVGASRRYTRRQVSNQGQCLPKESRRRRACLTNRQAR